MTREITEVVKQSGLKQASQYNNRNQLKLKNCPKDDGQPMLFAGDGMFDWIVICYECGFEVDGNNLKNAVANWNHIKREVVHE